MTDRVAYAEALTLRLVLDVLFAQEFIDKLGELIALCLCGVLIGKLIVEMVGRDRKVGKADEELDIESHLLGCLVDCLKELTLMKLLACHCHDAVDLLDHEHTRSIEIWGTHLYEVVHVVAIETCISRYEWTIALALLEFVELIELHILHRCWVVELIDILFGNELIIVVMREECGVVCIIHHETETTLAREIAELLMQTAVREEALDLVEIDIGIAALPCIEHLKVWPIMLWQHATILLLEFAKLCSTSWIWLNLCLNLLADILWNIEVVAERTLLDIVAILVVILIDILLYLNQSRWIGCDEDCSIDLDRKSHDGVITSSIVLDAIDASWNGI